MGPQFNELLCLYNKVLGMTNDYSFYSINSKIYEKELRFNETLLQQTNFTSPLALVCYGGSSVVEYLPIIFCPGSYMYTRCVLLDIF